MDFKGKSTSARKSEKILHCVRNRTARNTTLFSSFLNSAKISEPSSLEDLIDDVKSQLKDTPARNKACADKSLVESRLESSQSFNKLTDSSAPTPKLFTSSIFNFNRYLVRKITNLDNGDLKLNLTKFKTQNKDYECILKGFWSESIIFDGDVVNLVGGVDDENSCIISDFNGLLILQPDHLISGTTVISGNFCLRKAVLAERYKLSGGNNLMMLIGNIIHRLFQSAVKTKDYSFSFLQKLLNQLISEISTLDELYALNISSSDVRLKCCEYIPGIIKWSKQNYLKSASDFSILEVIDIEENFWSPKYGLKGKIDITVNTSDSKKHEYIAPIELKTGKASFSDDHQGQLNLYGLMLSEIYDNTKHGLLLYPKEPLSKLVIFDKKRTTALIQLRNKIVSYLTHRLDERTDDGFPKMSHLPEPINNDRFCSQCPYLLACCLHQKVTNFWHLNSDHYLLKLLQNQLSHLHQSHIDFFVKWSVLILIEYEDSYGSVRTGVSSLWCSTAKEREEYGNAFSDMILLTKFKFYDENNMHIFVKASNRDDEVQLSEIGISVGEAVVLSEDQVTKPRVAISSGFVIAINEKEVHVTLDRNLYTREDLKNKHYRIDRCDIFSTHSVNLGNLLKLMENNDSALKLRQIVIDGASSAFNTLLSKSDINKVRSLFKSLNKLQKAAILKILLTKDYVLIKGYPGSGKTTTIVVLILVLVKLGFSILLTSYTHSALDNILLKLRKQNVNFLRIGSLSRVRPELHKNSASLQSAACKNLDELSSLYDSVAIVATTALSLNHAVFSRRKFDVCIVDEASQILLPTCLGPLFLAKKFVLVGDPQQLPPIVKSRRAKLYGLSHSLFSLLDPAGATYELTHQYRMNREILRLCNVLVYNNSLTCATDAIANSNLEHPSECKLSSTSPAYMTKVVSSDLSDSVIFIDVKDVSDEKSVSGMVNNSEVNIIRTISKTFLKIGHSCKDIGIIAPYRAQVKLIKLALKADGSEEVEVNTVDQYQGRDKLIIILSFTQKQPRKIISTSAEHDSQDILNDKHRLNVAITRAKVKFIMIGDESILQTYPLINELLEIVPESQIIHNVQ